MVTAGRKLEDRRLEEGSSGEGRGGVPLKYYGK
jgi:hypothetical protein